MHVAGVDEAGMGCRWRGRSRPPLSSSPAEPASRTSTIGSACGPSNARELAPIIRERAVAWAVAYTEVDGIDCVEHLLGRAGGDASGGRGAGARGGTPADRRPAAGEVDLPPQPSSGATPRACRSPPRKSWRRRLVTRGWRSWMHVSPGYGFAQHKGYPVKSALQRAPATGRLPRSPAIVRGRARGFRAAAATAVASAVRLSKAVCKPECKPDWKTVRHDRVVTAIESTAAGRRRSRAAHKRSHAVTSTYPTALDNRCRASLRASFGSGVSAVDDDVDRVTQ